MSENHTNTNTSPSIQATVNGERRVLPAGATLADLITEMALQGQRFAVECNQEIVPKSTLADVLIQDQDTIEIVQAIGGG